ncbi:MAG: tail fiber domain-containing protein [Polyangiaceae bacterium]
MKTVHLFLGVGILGVMGIIPPRSAGATTCSAAGGCGNSVSSDYSQVLAGSANQIAAGAHYSVIDGGRSNYISSLSAYGAITGGYSNEIDSNGPYCYIGGGLNNYIYGGLSGNLGQANVIVGGDGNRISAVNSYAYIGGGQNNVISATNSLGEFIGGGQANLVKTGGNDCVILGGYGNATSGQYASVAGGYINSASGFNAGALGGYANAATGSGAVTLGGGFNTAGGNFSVAAGDMANADQNSCFVWADTSGAQQTCKVYPRNGTAYSVSNAFIARATGGFQFLTNTIGTPLTGVYLGAGSSVWTQVSDRNKKHGFLEVDERDALRRVAAMPITTWEYDAEANGARHMGPMAQDLYAAFGLGEDDKHVTSVDEDGVAMAAIQGLHAQQKEREAEVRALADRVSALEKRNAEQRSAVSAEESRATALEERFRKLKARLAASRAPRATEVRP